MGKNKSTTRSIDRALDILETFLHEGGNLSLTEIAESTKLNSSTAHRIVSALLERKFLIRNNQKKYNLGPKITELGNISNINIDNQLKRIAKGYMIELKDKYDEDVRLFVVDGREKLCIESIQSSKISEHIMDVGDKHDILSGAPGRVFLAYMNKEKRKNIIENSEITEKDLKTVKEKGYALSIGEKKEGLVGLAAPIMDNNNNIIASMSLSGPAQRMIDEEISDKIADVIATAKKIGDNYAKLQTEKTLQYI